MITMSAWKQFLQSKVVRNAGWLIFGKIAQMVISFFVGIITARYLGPSNYGLINYAASYTAFFTAFCTLGINSVLVKEIIGNRQSEGTVMGTALLLRGVSSLLSAVTIVMITIAVDRNEPAARLVVLLYSIGLFFQIFDTFNYWFQAKLQSRVTSIAALIAYIITSGYKIVLLILEKDVAYFAFASSVDHIVMAALLFFSYYRCGGEKLRFSFSYGKKLLSQSYHFILSGLMVSIYGYTDKIMLKHMIDNAESGYYSTAVTICGLWCFVLSAVIDSLVPPIMEAFQTDEALFRKKNIFLYRFVFYISVIVSLCLSVFSEPVIRILYGADFLPAAVPLRIITWYTAFSYLGVARNAWIVCKKKQNCLKYIYFIAAVMNVILNFLCIPVLGASGAALASLLTQILTAIVIPLFFPGLRENSLMMLDAILFRKE